jgi:23S rRNA pseudouridine1911/1915/1917 synthase
MTKVKNRSGGILINGERVTVRYVLTAGDILDFSFEDGEADESEVVPNEELLDLIDIVYEDEYILCVNKPPDMPSHPSFNHFSDTLANAAAAYFSKSGQNRIFRAANRLDRGTSGLVLIAKDKLTSSKLNAIIKRGEMKKVYTAIVTGDLNELSAKQINLQHLNGVFEYNPETQTGRIIAPIKRAQDSIITRICTADGDYSETAFRFIKSNGEISLAEIYPKTGRTHQIRLHFKTIGYPLLGDDLYFSDFEQTLNFSVKYGAKRHALHANSLEFQHPGNKKNIKIECGLCEDMQRIAGNI